MARKPGKMSKAAGYDNRVFSLVYDLRSMVELLGLPELINVATVLNEQSQKSKGKARAHKARKVKSTANASPLSQEFQRNLARELAKLAATSNINRKAA